MSVIDHALAFATHGYRVHPLKPGTDLPIFEDWPNQATWDHDQIIEWLKRYPNANIGVATGLPSMVSVLHVDVKGSVNGLHTLEALAARGKQIPPCPVSITPAGGLQLWFKYTNGLPNCAGRSDDGRGIGAGIYFINDDWTMGVPPSVVPGVGRFHWRFPPKEVRPPRLPDWAINMLKPREIRPQRIKFRTIQDAAGSHLDHLASHHQQRDARFRLG